MILDNKLRTQVTTIMTDCRILWNMKCDDVAKDDMWMVEFTLKKFETQEKISTKIENGKENNKQIS